MDRKYVDFDIHMGSRNYAPRTPRDGEVSLACIKEACGYIVTCFTYCRWSLQNPEKIKMTMSFYTHSRIVPAPSLPLPSL